MMLKYYFTIIDTEVNDTYEWIGYFTDHMEADRFITENENCGNTVIMNYPFYEEIPVESVNLNSICYPEG